MEAKNRLLVNGESTAKVSLDPFSHRGEEASIEKTAKEVLNISTTNQNHTKPLA